MVDTSCIRKGRELHKLLKELQLKYNFHLLARLRRYGSAGFPNLTRSLAAPSIILVLKVL